MLEIGTIKFPLIFTFHQPASTDKNFLFLQFFYSRLPYVTIIKWFMLVTSVNIVFHDMINPGR